jgi:2-polyprenyl-6-hydroxyphenyl methylase/3-demethylubiquinone-9 3-methyltransferase
MSSASVSLAEIVRFDALAARWWDPEGPMRPLHRMNPARVGWIVDHVARRFPDAAGLRVLDVGCGAGLAAEALARRGFGVLGVDAAPDVIAAAADHAKEHDEKGQSLRLTYRVGTAEDVLADGLRFPVVTALEVIEHVPDPAAFVQTLAALLEPGGLVFLSTLNRTRRSFLSAKVGAEYLLRWLPVGTHDWRKFVTPAELSAMLRDAGLRVADAAGLVPDPLRGGWRTGRDLSVNYMMAAEG